MTSKIIEDFLDEEQKSLLAGLTSPAKIQAFLDDTPYSASDENRCPRRVIQERLAHCLDGGLFAAAALRRLGYPPLIVDLLPEPKLDDDHVLAVFKYHGCYGAVAKSNFSGLRFREPVFCSLRELVMSYFEDFFNVDGLKTMRGYSRPLHLAAYDRMDWEVNDRAADAVEKRLKKLHCIPVLADWMASELSPTDALSYQAGMLGTNPDGLYKPKP
jgi:hypothetical protein